MDTNANEQEQLIVEWEAAGLIPVFDPQVRAFHEAAHVLCAIRLGFQVVSVDIIRRILPSGSDPLVGKIIYGTCRTSPSPANTERDRMLVDLAGGIGEAIFTGVPAVGDVGDTHLYEGGPSKADLEAVTKIVQDSWDAISEIARLLLENTALDGATVREIIVKHSTIA
jgi:hypothetical protein